MGFKSIALAAITLVLSTSVNATTITFDDLGDGTTANISFPSNYYDLTWSGDNHRILDTSLYANQDSGFIIGAVSQDNVAVYRNNATISSISGSFDFNGAYITAGWNDGLNVFVEGKLGGEVLFSSSLLINSYEAVWYNFNWQGIDQITFTSSGGVNAGYGGSGAWTAIDNFTINAVPVPAAVWLFGSGLIGLISIARRKKS